MHEKREFMVLLSRTGMSVSILQGFERILLSQGGNAIFG